MDPLNGSFTMGEADYSPAALLFFDFTWRIAGVRKEGSNLQWNLRPLPSSARVTYTLKLSSSRTATLTYAAGLAHLAVNNRELCRTGSTVRLVTDDSGDLKHATGIADTSQNVLLRLGSGRKMKFAINPNETLHI